MENPCAEIKLYPRYYPCDTQENADLAVEAYLAGNGIGLDSRGQWYQYAEERCRVAMENSGNRQSAFLPQKYKDLFL